MKTGSLVHLASNIPDHEAEPRISRVSAVTCAPQALILILALPFSHVGPANPGQFGRGI